MNRTPHAGRDGAPAFIVMPRSDARICRGQRASPWLSAPSRWGRRGRQWFGLRLAGGAHGPARHGGADWEQHPVLNGFQRRSKGPLSWFCSAPWLTSTRLRAGIHRTWHIDGGLPARSWSRCRRLLVSAGCVRRQWLSCNASRCRRGSLSAPSATAASVSAGQPRSEAWSTMWRSQFSRQAKSASRTVARWWENRPAASLAAKPRIAVLSSRSVRGIWAGSWPASRSALYTELMT